MPKLAANLTTLFTEARFMDRFSAAARAGFRGIEFLFPYAFHADQIADQLSIYQLDLVLYNLPAGKWAEGERGIACHPDRVEEFQSGVDEAISYAKILGNKQLNCMVGIKPQHINNDHAYATLVENLGYAARKLKAANLKLLIEPVNSHDVPGYFLTTTRQALALINDTGSDNLYVQYDIYHMQRTEGEVAGTLQSNLPMIKHIQLADHPGRSEPGTGEVNDRYLLAMLDRIGYEGWVGCEYLPKASTIDGLSWREECGIV